MYKVELRATLAALAPGGDMRDGLERILRGRTGAIIVLRHVAAVEELCSGGFELDVEFTPSRLRELAKMDGAVVVDREAGRIRRANVQLLPDPSIPTTETGMRHRTAQRVSLQTGVPVISVSKSMHTIALYVDGHRHVLESADVLTAKANQALATLERYQSHATNLLDSLTSLEIEDAVTVRDVVQVAMRIEMVNRISREIDGYVVELGSEGRLVQLQLIELVAGIPRRLELVLDDYSAPEHGQAAERLAALSAADLANSNAVAKALRLPEGELGLDAPLTARGYRMLDQVPRLPRPTVDAIVGQMGSVRQLLASTTEELLEIEGVGPLRARAIREGLSRIAEAAILERRYQA